MFDYNYTTLEVKGDIAPTRKKSLMLPYGICMKINITKSKPRILLSTKQKVHIIAADPYTANDVWTEIDQDSVTSIGPYSENLYERGVYELEYSVHDATHDELTCTDYTKTKQNYQECIRTLIKQKFREIYGCLPPWVPANETENICKTEMRWKKNTNNVFQFVNEILDNREVEMFKQCLLPCVSMKMKLQRTRHETNWPEHVRFTVHSKAWANKRTEFHSYNGFNFIVDFGSALGLWMGLSCLSILDQVLENWVLMQNYWKK